MQERLIGLQLWNQLLARGELQATGQQDPLRLSAALRTSFLYFLFSTFPFPSFFLLYPSSFPVSHASYRSYIDVSLPTVTSLPPSLSRFFRYLSFFSHYSDLATDGTTDDSWFQFNLSAQNLERYILRRSDKMYTSCLYRASVTIKTLYYPTDAQIYNS